MQTPPKKSWPSYDVVKVHFKSDAYDTAEEYLKELLKENEDEVEESGGRVRSLARKTYDYTVEEENHQNRQCNLPLHENEINTVDTILSEDETEDDGATAISSLVPNTSSYSEGVKPSQEKQKPGNSTIHTASPTPATSTNDSKSNTSLASTVTINSGDFSALWSNISKLTVHVEQQTIMLHELVRMMRKSDQQLTLTPPRDLPKFPIQTSKEFKDLNQKLTEDTTLSDYLIARLAAVKGSTLDSLTRRILKFLMSDQVAVQYNWKGREKKSFEKTKIMSLIYDAVKRNFPSDERNDLLIANTCKEWLKHAKARMKAKK